MPITAQLADGRILEFPDGTDPAVIQSTVKRIIAESPQEKGAGFSLSDLASSFMQGAYGSTQALTDVLGAGNVASQALEERARASQAGMSAARQAELARQQERSKKAEQSGSTWEEIKAAAQNIAEAPLQSAAQAVGSFVPYLPTMFLGPAAGVLGLGARATAAATAVARGAPAVIGTAQGAGAVKGAIYDAVYEAEVKDGRSPEEARAKALAAQEYAGENIDQIATGAGLGFAAGRFGAESLLRPGAAATASRSMAGRIGMAAAADVPTEALQGGQERLAANIALQREGYDVPTFQGVAGQAAQEGLLGLLGSAPVAAVRGPDVDALRQEELKKQAEAFEAEKARALAEAGTRMPEQEIALPGGFKIQREEVAREAVPESFGLFVEGVENPLTTVPTQEEAQAKLESFTQIREKEREDTLAQIDKLNEEVQKRRDRIDYLEATGQTATEEYQQAKATLPQQEEAAETKARELAERIETLGKPVTITPIGQREAVQERFNVISPTGQLFETHATQGEAEASVRNLLGEEVFKEAELKKGRDERIAQLEKELVPAMQKFGLKDVALKVVDQIENNAGGAYLNKLIRVAYDEPKPLQTMRHESVHALKDLGFFTPQQWKALEERAKKQWIKEFLENQTTEIDGQQMSRLEGYRKIGYSEDAIIEEAIADAFGAYDKGATPPPGLIASLFKKLKNFFTNFGQALRGAGFESADDIFQRVERGELKPSKAKAEKAAPKSEPKKEPKAGPAQRKAEGEAPEPTEAAGKEKLSIKPSTWKATKAGVKQADEYFDENGIMPYTSEGQIEVPLDVSGTKYSIKRPYDQKAMSKDQTLKNDPLTGLPMNANGTVTLYFPTDNEGARDLARTKRLKGSSPTANRIYLTNESSAPAVQNNPGMIDQPLGGANVLLQVDPSLLHLLEEHEDGRKDFFIPIAEGEYFAKKMSQTKLFTLNAPRTKGLHPDRTLSQVTKMVNETATKWASATKAQRAEMARDAKKVLKDEHNIEKLFGANAKLEKTNIGDYGLTYKGKKVMSTGLGFASAQKINDEQRATTCPQSAICEALCLGETSGQNLLYGGEGEFRSGPRLSQFLKTEALVVNPEAFAVTLIKQIENFRNAAKKLGYQPAIRLNVTSDFNPKTFENIIKMFPDVMFYDYTKLDTKPIAENHHLTYSSTGASQVVNGETVVNKESNWDRMVDKVLSNGKNVAMAFTSRNDMPKFILDERTGKRFEVWNGDEYDARFLDPIKEDGQGWIIGLTNKDRTTSPEEAAKKHNGFFLDYDKARDGETLVIQNQDRLAGKPSGKVVPIAKLSLKAPATPQFKQWFGDSKIVDAEGQPKVMYHGLAKDTTDFTRKTARGAPIFLTDDPVFADRFAYDSFEGIASNSNKYLTEAQIKDGMKNAIAMVRKDYGKDTFGKEIIDSIKSGDIKNATPEAKEYLGKALKDMLPTGPHVMPLYVRAENPFDYQNPRHIYRLKEEVDLDDDLWRSIREGDWDTIESQEVQDAIQFAGFDSFYVKEHGRKNLAVYDANQVKSATGNIGTFSRDTSDVRYSLTSYPSVKQAQKAADDTPVPETAEFKLYIAGSQWLDDDGKAKKFFHATVGDFFTFQDGVIYLSETAADSEKFGREKEGDLRSRIYRALRKEEKLPLFQRAVDKAVQNGKITEERGEKFMRDAKRSIPEFDRYSSIKEEMDDELMALSPQFMKIMPLYARAMMPFDFNNPDHRDQVVSYIESRTDLSRNVSEDAREQARRLGVPSEFPDEDIKGLRGRLKNGFTTTIEKPQVQKAIRALNFDGFISRKAIGSPLTYAVYQPQQVKSVTGNDGDFSFENKDIRFSLRSVRYSPARFEEVYMKSMYTNNDTTTRGYLGFVQPMDFVRATSSESMLKRLRSEQEPVDFAKMRTLDPIKLAMSKRDGDNWKIIDHSGRHRMLALADAGYRDIPVYIEFSSGIEDAESIPTKLVRAQDPDSIDSFLAIAQLEPLSYANRSNAEKVFTREQPVKYSLPQMPTALDTRVGETTATRDPQNFAERITKAISPQGFSYFRQKNIHRYNQAGVYDKVLRQGGVELLADQSAEAACLMSDLGAGVAASAMGMGDRHGGIPVYRNGITTIDRSVKGLIAVLQPLARYGDPKIYQYYQYWAMVKRGVRLNAEGKPTGIDNTDVQYAKYLESKFPEFVTVQKEFIEFNNGLVKYARDTGVISADQAQAFMKHADYVPFYRQMDGETTVGPNIFQSIAGVRPPKKLKGGTAPLADFLETAVRNTQSMIQAGMKNAAAQKVASVAVRVKAPGMGAERLDYNPPLTPDIFQVLENGKIVSYRTPDHLLLDAIKSLNMAELPFMGILAGPANALRNLVTKEPGFMMANLIRDSLSAWVTSGQKMTPIAGTVINFGKALAGKSKGFDALIDAGVIGGYELSQNIERSGQELEDDLAKKAGKKAPLPLRPFTSLWEGLEKGTTASDAATRALVYERVMKETGNEAEALFRALEVMNFNRKGNSPLIRVLTATVPFLNARIQGLDVFYRASTGNMNMADRKAIRRQFWARGASMMALSCYYYLLVNDEDDYKKQEQETKDNNWIIPSLGLRIPIPFEVGVLFKTIPERIMAYHFGNDTGQDFKDSMKRNFINTFAFNPTPQIIKPIAEAAVNFNPFTWRQIVGQGMQDVAPEFQVGPGTSKIAKAIGESLGLSPIKVDHIIKGYTGTIGMYAIDVIDTLMDQFSDSPKAAKRFEQMPVIKRFAVDPEARGTVTAYYQLKDSVDTTVRTMNLLERSMEPEKFAKYVQDNIGVLAVKDYVRDMEKTMKETREMRQAIQASPMSAEEKRDALSAINEAENNLTSNIQYVKKAVASLK